jgi:F-type H+-transporting ATPase subunit b
LAHAIVEAGRAKLKEESAKQRGKLESELAKRSAEAEARIGEAKTSAMREVNAVAVEVAADIVRQLIGLAPAKAEIEKAVQTARKD